MHGETLKFVIAITVNRF